MLSATFHKTRLAPTPSGYLHLGNIYSFALTAALAKQSSASILLRIDDMDRERVQRSYIHDIFETLQFLGIPWNEGPRNPEAFDTQYSQRHRLSLYQKALDQLRERGLVYACNCSRSQLQQQGMQSYPCTCRHKGISLDEEQVAWRLRTEADANVTVRTMQGTIEVPLPAAMHDVIVRKKDGFPAYQLSSVIDDVHFGIDFIVRGQDLWESTLVQLYLASLLGETHFLNTTFYHHPLLLDEAERKLSKSAGDTSVHYLRQHGYDAEMIYALLGKKFGLKKDVKGWEDFLIP